ncbi:hypothetical protein EB001_19295 [bacterium]|nr:hypothetical protein [bacterium]
MAEKEYTKDELAEWFKTKLTSPKTMNTSVARNKLMNAETRWTDNDSVFVGGLFFFKYVAKGKETLPVWDKFPMAMIIDRYNDGFLALNMHYLPKGRRASLIAIVEKFKGDRKMSNVVRAKAKNWQYMKDSSGGAATGYMNKTVKRYLFTHVRSQFIKINADEYDKAIQLPLEEWVYKR